MAVTENTKPYRITNSGGVLLVAPSAGTKTGDFDRNVLSQYEKDISAAIASINPAATELRFDFTTLTVFVGDVESQVRYFLNRFKPIGFQKITFRCGASAILKMQANRIAKELGMGNFEAV